jgi:hypothetical protein
MENGNGGIKVVSALGDSKKYYMVTNQGHYDPNIGFLEMAPRHSA